MGIFWYISAKSYPENIPYFCLLRQLKLTLLRASHIFQTKFLSCDTAKSLRMGKRKRRLNNKGGL